MVRRRLERRLRRFARAQVAGQPRRIDQEQHDRPDHRDRDLVAARPVTGAVGDAEDHDQKRREQQQHGGVVRQTDAEAHHAVGRRARAGDDRETEDEQRVGKQRTEN